MEDLEQYIKMELIEKDIFPRRMNMNARGDSTTYYEGIGIKVQIDYDHTGEISISWHKENEDNGHWKWVHNKEDINKVLEEVG